MAQTNDRQYNAQEAADRVGRAYSTIRDHIRKGRLHAGREGREFLIAEDELRCAYPDAFTDAREDRDVDSAAEAPVGAPSVAAEATAGGADAAGSGAAAEVTAGGADAAGGDAAAEVTVGGGAGSGAGGRPDVQALHIDHAAATQENQVLRLKLEHSEREHESTRREHETLQRGLERAETEVEHLRGLTTQQAETAQNLTEEIKGLTIALHHEQNQRLELASPSKDEDEERNGKTESAGFLRRVFKRKPKRKQGKFARVGPAQT